MKSETPSKQRWKPEHEASLHDSLTLNEVNEDRCFVTVCVSVRQPGTPINKPPVLGYKDLNLFKLFRLVCRYGGCRKVSATCLSEWSGPCVQWRRVWLEDSDLVCVMMSTVFDIAD